MNKNFNIDDLIDKKEIEDFLKKKKFTNGDFFYLPYGETTVRLLPRLESKIPWKMVKVHRFYHGENLIIGNCPKMFGHKNCPVCETSWSWKNSGDPALESLSSQSYARTRYIYNAYIVDTEDEDSKESIGNVKLIEVGKKLHEMIQSYFNDDDYGKKIFDPYEGYNFVIKKVAADNYPSYSGSRFSPKLSSIDIKWDELKKMLINIDDILIKETPDSIKKKFKPFFDMEEKEAASVAPQNYTPDDNINDDGDDDIEDELKELLKED